MPTPIADPGLPLRKGRTVPADPSTPSNVPARVSSTSKPAVPLVEPARRHSMISEAAYFLAEHRGFGPGHELEDWLRAEHEIDGGGTPVAAKKTTAPIHAGLPHAGLPEHPQQVGAPDLERRNSPIQTDPEQSFELLREQVGDEAAECYFNGVQFGDGAVVLSGSTRLRCEHGIWVDAGTELPR